MEKGLSHEELEEQFNKVDGVLKQHETALNEHPDLKSNLEETKTLLAVSMMNHWLPRDLGRRLIMLVILIIGISGAMAGNSGWLFLLLVLPLFSPKVIMRVAIIIGYLQGNHKK
jgi:hypothetical protein